MRLQESISRYVGERIYIKHEITIPNEIVESLGWLGGDELEFETRQGLLLVFKKSTSEMTG